MNNTPSAKEETKYCVTYIDCGYKKTQELDSLEVAQILYDLKKQYYTGVELFEETISYKKLK